MEEGSNKRQRAGSISGRLRTASDLEQCGLIDTNQKGVLKDMIIAGDSTLQGALEKYEQGDSSELEALIKSGTLSDRRSSIDLLDGLDLDFLGNTLGDSFDGFEFDGTTDPFDESKFRYRTESNVSVDQNLLEERNSLTGERLSIPKVKEENDPPPAPAKTGTLPTNNSSSSSSNSQNTASGSNPALSVGYDPLFASNISYEEQRLRAGSFHTEQQQQRARAHSLLMDNIPPRGHGDGFNGGYRSRTGSGAFNSNPDVDTFGGGPGAFGNYSFGGVGMGGQGTVGSFGASPDIDYGMGIYEQRLRGNSFHQVNGDQRLRAGSFQLYPLPQSQQQNLMPPPANKNMMSGFSGGASSSNPGEKRLMHQVESKPPQVATQPSASASYQPQYQHNSTTQNSSESRKGYIGTYSPEARKDRINRFIEKRKNRVWTKKVKYDVRKNFADSRIRVKGRFVKKEDEEKMRLELGEEEWARLVAKSQGLA